MLCWNRIKENISERPIKENTDYQPVSDLSTIEPLVDQVLAENPQSIEDFKAGKITRIDAYIGKYLTDKRAINAEKARTGTKWVAVFEPIN